MGKHVKNLWLKLLIVVLTVCGFLIIAGYSYYRNTSCVGNLWDCLEFEIIIFGGGLLAFSLPIVIILFFWELSKKIRKKKDEEINVIENKIENVDNFEKTEDKLSRSVLDYAKKQKND